MKLSEIKKISSRTEYIKQTKPKVAQLRFIKNFEGYDLYKAALDDPRYFYLEFRDRDKIIGWYVYRLIQLHDEIYVNDQRIFVEDEYLNKGIASKFYYYILKIEKIPILSDEEVTPDGEQFYKKISSKFKTSILNVVTGEKEKFSLNKWNDIFSNDVTNYRLIFEILQPSLTEGNRNEVLAPYLQFGLGDI